MVKKKKKQNTKKHVRTLQAAHKISDPGTSRDPFVEDELVQLLNDPQNSDLLGFTKEFYELLEKENPHRITFSRSTKDARLEGLSRLLVGDETCVALALDGEHMLVASNRNNHLDLQVSVEPDFFILPNSSYKDGFLIQPECRVCIIKESKKYEFRQLEDPIKYNLRIDTLVPVKDFFQFKPSQKLILEWQQLGFQPVLSGMAYTFSLAEIPEATSFFFQSICRIEEQHSNPLDFKAIDKIGMRSLLPKTNIDPFRRRIDVVLQHLAFACQITLRRNKDLALDGKVALEKQRARLLQQTFAWEVAKWFGKNRDLRDYTDAQKDKFKETVDNFISLIYENFCSCSSNFNMEERLKQIKEKIRTGNIVVPQMLGSQIKRFLKDFHRYLKDIEKIESFVVDDTKRNGSFSSFLINRVSPYLPSPVIILDDLENNVHAEMRVIWHFFRDKKTPGYLAISKLCCAHCTLVVKQLNITAVCGSHGKAYPNWKLSEAFIKDKKFLKRILGESLYKKYVSLIKKNIMFDGVQYSKGYIALLIVQSIATLSEKSLIDLKISTKRLWADAGSEFPDELDEKSIQDQYLEDQSYLQSIECDYRETLKQQGVLIKKLGLSLTDYQILNKYKDIPMNKDNASEKKELYELTLKLLSLHQLLIAQARYLRQEFINSVSNSIEWYVIIDNQRITFTEQEVAGDGWCALNAAGIVDPESSINQLKENINNELIHDYLMRAIANNIHAISLEESFNITGFDSDNNNIHSVIWDLYFELQQCVVLNSAAHQNAYAKFMNYISRHDVLKVYLDYLISSRYVDQNIVAACLEFQEKKLVVFHNYLDSGQLTCNSVDDFNLEDPNTVCLIFHPGTAQGNAHYNLLRCSPSPRQESAVEDMRVIEILDRIQVVQEQFQPQVSQTMQIALNVPTRSAITPVFSSSQNTVIFSDQSRSEEELAILQVERRFEPEL